MIAVVGLSHKIAPLEVRERFALAPEEGGRLLSGLPGEALLLVTCNRTELYGTAAPDDLRHALVVAAGGPPDAPLIALRGRDAARHLLSVAAGLDSMVLGEPQVLGQVREALAAARQRGRLGPVLDRLGRQALIAGRRVRTETVLGRDRPSIPRVAVQVAAEVLTGLAPRTLLVIGAGKVGGLTARALRRAGAQTVLVTNRTAAAATRLAEEIGALAAPFDALDDLLGQADIVISCTGSPTPLLDEARLARIVAGRTERPLVLIDIAVPRDVAPAARAIPGVRLFDLDDLRSAAAARIDPAVVAQAEAIVEEESRAFLTWLAGRQAVPTIRALRQRAEIVLEEELARASGDEARLREFGRRLLNKILHHPVVRMRDRAATHGSAYLDIARDLFALDGREDG